MLVSWDKSVTFPMRYRTDWLLQADKFVTMQVLTAAQLVGQKATSRVGKCLKTNSINPVICSGRVGEREPSRTDLLLQARVRRCTLSDKSVT